MAATKKSKRVLKKDQMRAIAKEREKSALELRKGGATYKQIAAELGLYDAAHAKHYVDKGINSIVRDAALDVVRMDLERLDEYMMRCTAALRNNGDLNQIDRLMRIMDKRYQILGVASQDKNVLQGEHGINVTNNDNRTTQIVMAAPESQEDFIKKMMQATGVDPESETAKKYLAEKREQHPLPIKGTDNEAANIKGELLDADTITE